MASRFTVPVGSIAGIPIRVHLLLPALAAVHLFSTPDYAHGVVLLALGCFYGVMVLSTLAHELGHAFVARHNHLQAHEILLWPLGGLTTLDRERSPRARVQVALAGVAVNLLLALAAGAAMLLRRGELPGMPRLVLEPDFLVTAWNLNLVQAVFNLLPGLPLDGGAATEGLLWRKHGRKNARLAVLVSGAIINAGFLVGGIANENSILASVGGWGLMVVFRLYQELRNGEFEGETLLGTYDFSRGYTSLEESTPEPEKVERRREREKEKARRDGERRAAADRDARESAKIRLDRLLERIAAEGIAVLSADERAFLDEESRRLRAMKRGKSPTRP